MKITKEKISLRGKFFRFSINVISFFEQYRMVAHKYNKLSNRATVGSVDYHKAPNYVFPKALEDELKINVY